MPLNPGLQDYVEGAKRLTKSISPDRREKLAVLVDYVTRRHASREPVALNFICTHNSRRSHLGQLWAAVAADHYGVESVSTYSGGTEATAFNPRAVAAIQRAGFEVTHSDGENPRYEVRFSNEAPASVCFSKRYDDEHNPSADFAAVMTCTDADQNCPAIIGATRISLPYRDPKEADATPVEAERYDERCLQIAVEMLWAFEQISAQARG